MSCSASLNFFQGAGTVPLLNELMPCVRQICLFLLLTPVQLFCDLMYHSLPGSFVHGICQPGILKWVAIAFSRGFSQPRDWTYISCIGRWILYHWATCRAYRLTKILLNYQELEEYKLCCCFHLLLSKNHKIDFSLISAPDSPWHSGKKCEPQAGLLPTGGSLPDARREFLSTGDYHGHAGV